MALYLGSDGEKYRISSNGGVFRVSVPKIEKKHGLYYNQPYSGTLDAEGLATFVFTEDYIMYVYVDGFLNYSKAYTLTEDNQILVDNSDRYESDWYFDIGGDGSYIELEGFKFILNTQKHDLYFNKKYKVDFDGYVQYYTFYEDGSFVMIDSDELTQYSPEGSCTYIDNKIILGDIVAYISLDGTQIILCDETEGMILTHEYVNTNLLFNQPYALMINGKLNGYLVFSDTMHMLFYNTEGLARGNAIPFYINQDGDIVAEDITTTFIFKISEDGSNLTLEDSHGMDCSITTNIEKDNIRFGKIYTVELSSSDISGFIFHENGNLETIWRDGRDNEIFPDACKYYDNIIIVRLGEYAVFNISLDGKQITAMYGMILNLSDSENNLLSSVG